ncbi:MAG: hypothetical protein JW395_0801 [Nitrospira sp.]|nr:hypothetical protein [Nitrospira sp.]
MEEQRTTFLNRAGLQIVGTISRTAADPAPAVLVIPGFRGDQGERHIVAVAHAIAEAGIVALRFDPTCNTGDSGGEFRRLTVSGEVSDAEDALAFLRKHPWVDGDRVGITGHSVGGLVAALTAVADPTIRAVVTLSAVFDLAERFALLLSADTIRRWADEGSVEMDPPGSGLYLDYEFYRDAMTLNLPAKLAMLRSPILAVQGAADVEVPVEDARLYYRHVGSAVKDLAIIAGAGHSYREASQLAEVCEQTAGWFRRYL